MYRIGIDVGGTFTDVTLLNSETGAYYTYKLSSTLHDQSEAIANGTKETLALYGVPVEQLEYFGHGTTVATNMIIERKGAKTALITTKGFRDLLEIGRQTRPSLYDIMEDKPETLVRRALRREVDERTMADGTILRKANRDGAAGTQPAEGKGCGVAGGMLPVLLPEPGKRANCRAVHQGDLARGLLLRLLHHSSGVSGV